MAWKLACIKCSERSEQPRGKGLSSRCAHLHMLVSSSPIFVISGQNCDAAVASGEKSPERISHAGDGAPETAGF